MIGLLTIYHHQFIHQYQILLVCGSTIQKNKIFFLCVDDSGIKYFSDEYAHHLLKSLQKYYSVTVDMEGGGGGFGLILILIMTMAMLASKFPITSLMHCIVFNTRHHHNHNIPHMITTQSGIERNTIIPKVPTYLKMLTRKKQKMCNR